MSQPQLKLYNTLTNSLDVFEPVDPAGRQVLMYSCGPTVYDYAHIGNFRSFLSADTLRRTLELLGYDVRHVMNLTDVGHMVDDEAIDGEGDDKMEVAAARLKQSKKDGTLPEGANVDPNDPFAIADFYAQAFIEDAKTLGIEVVRDAVKHPEVLPRATQHIDDIIDFIKDLIDRGHAYIGNDGVVYYDVQSFDPYGTLSGNTLDQLRSGAGGRVDAATQKIKRHPADFMLWKPDDTHLMKWDSPWGTGYPGWHIECSVMSSKHLAPDTGVIDIHTGGEDLIFPHHECEIAQSCGRSGASHFARYWVHTRFLIVEGEKMSKSKGNFFTVRDMLTKGSSPAALRLELIRMHYGDQANFTMQGLRDCQGQIDRWLRLRAWLTEHADEPVRAGAPLADAIPAFTAALCNNLNVSGAIAALNEAVGQYNLDQIDSTSSGTDSAATHADELAALEKMARALGVFDVSADASMGGDEASRVEALIDGRNAARERKDFAEADRIRDELTTMGIEIKDSAEGTTWRRVVS